MGLRKRCAAFVGVSAAPAAVPERASFVVEVNDIMASLKLNWGTPKLPLAFTITVSTPFQSNVVYY